MQRMKLRLPWVTLTGTPDGPGIGPKVKCLGAMLLHEAVELTVGTERAHAMASCRRYAVEAVVAGAAIAEGAMAAEGAAAAGAAEAGAAGGMEGAAAEGGGSGSFGGQFKNLSPMQFGGGQKQMKDSTTPQVGGHPNDFDDPGYVS